MPATITFTPIPGDPDRVLMTETWRLDAPDCPFIRSPWHAWPFGDERIETITTRVPVPSAYPDLIAHRAGGASK